ncbi:TIGR03086 family metal-binding protein [Actinacidiphila yeochonensis]|uniref:TIGR03086 family metal-binding protein n=1 Tax=Actinacidiphila yeochonensis TaxID=89050 RepID=UPI00056ABE74|nr:TIGR03086 family metal-binding protein [Actinacidiphila yeochonensis]
MADTAGKAPGGGGQVDLGGAARRVAELAAGVGEGRLADPTPSPGMAVRNLLGHLVGLSQGFQYAARKERTEHTGRSPAATVPDVDDDGAWRDELPLLLDGLAEAWRDPAAWEGMTQIGGVELPGGQAGLVALNELVVHGWDLARSTGQPYDAEPAELDLCRELLAASVEQRPIPGLFDVAVEVPPDAPLLDRVIGLSGRDPSWRP